jgi:superfamily I DNA and/or RNA helicase
MRREKSTNLAPPQFVPGRQYRGLRGKVVEWVEHKFEEGLLYIHVRFADKTELCWRIATRMVIEEGDLSDWKSGDFEQLRVFVENERDRSL